jgi:acyl dehydratase
LTEEAGSVPLLSSIVDVAFRTRTHRIDERSLMAFAAGAGDARPELVDTARPGGIVAHPLFPAALEWLSIQDVAAELRERGVGWHHVLLAAPLDYDLRWRGPIRPGDVLSQGVEVPAVKTVPDGTVLTIVASSSDSRGSVVTRSRSHVLLPDVRFDGRRVRPDSDDDRRASRRSRSPARDDAVIDLRSEWTNTEAVIRRGHRRIGAPAAHVFSECSGIWNPVYTDKAMALRHGRAFLALPPAGVLAMTVGGALQLGSADPGWVRRVHAEFGAPVPVPSILEIEAEVPNRPSGSAPLRFRAHLQDGTPVVTTGVLVAEPTDFDVDMARARARAERRRLVRTTGRRLA